MTLQIIEHSNKTYQYASSAPNVITQTMEISKEGHYKPESWLIRNGYKNIGFERRLLKQMGKITELEN